MRKAGVWLWIAAVLAVLVGVASYRYLLPGMPGAAPTVVGNRFAATGALVAHAGVGATALILGALQFFPRLRARWPAWHRRAGTVYVICCLLGGLAGLTLAFGTTAGPIAGLGFGGLAVAWLISTANAWRYARAGDFVRHPRWMIRGYALTFAAVTLRLYLGVFGVVHADFMTGYRIAAWLCWIPNLIFVEAFILRQPAFRTSPPLAAPSRSPG